MHITASELRSYYAGLILSDGRIDNGVKKRAFVQASINKDFIDSIENYTIKNTNFKTKVRLKPAYKDKNGTKHKDSWHITVGANPYFAKLYHYFYNDYGVKRPISESISWLNSPQAWANMYASDGYICRVGIRDNYVTDCRVDFCTDAFSKSNVEKLAEQFSKTFDAKTSILRRKINGKVMYRVRVAKADAQRFFLQIDPYVPASMKYKLYMRFDEPQKWLSPEYIEFCESLKAQGLEEKLV